jgi:sugar lactone lactonase YvrE
VADSGNNRVAELAVSGAGFAAPVTVLSGLSAPGGIAADWNGNLFVSDTGNGRVLMLPAAPGGFGAVVTVAEGLSNPAGLALDSSDDVFVACPGTNDVRKITAVSGSYQSPMVVGTGYNAPMGVALDANRNLYIADTGNGRVVKEPLSSTGYATEQVMWSSIDMPTGLAMDKTGDLYIAASGGQQVIEKVWQTGAARFGSNSYIGTGMTAPAGVAINAAGHVFIADAGSNQVLEIETASVDFGAVAVGAGESSLTYNFTLAAGTALSGVSILTQGVPGKDFIDGGATTCTAQTYAVATSCGVNVSFSPLAPGARLGAVVLWGTSANALATAFISGVGQLAKLGFIPGSATQIGSGLSGPSGVAVDGAGDVYIADTGNNRVVELPWTGNGYGAQAVVPIAGLMNPMGLSVDNAGNLYIASNGNDKVIYLPWTPSGFGLQGKVGSGLYGPSNVAVGANGTVFITDTLDQRIDNILWTGNGFAQETNVGNYHKAPIGVAVDAIGNVFFSDPYQNSVSMVPWSGTRFLDQVTVPVQGTAFPCALAVDSNSDIFILDSVNNDVIMLPWEGTSFGPQMTVASGFNAPTGLTIDANGVLYVADTGNNQIVKIDMSVPGGMSYAPTYLGSTSSDSPRAAMVGNLGNLPVNLSAVSYPVDFPEGTGGANGCTGNSTLAMSGWCELAVNFTPSVTGSALNETVTVTDDSLGVADSQQQIPVSGTSLAKAAQTINFTAPTNAVYGAAPIGLAATSSSGLQVQLNVVSGPGVLSPNGKLLRLSGVGTVVVQATQNGNGSFAAAPTVTVSVSVAPAVVTVTPLNVNATYGAIPADFDYSLSGLVNGDSSSVISGAPVIAASAGPSAGVGSYLLQASQGSLAATNYVFAFASGTLTVNPATLQIHVLSQTVIYGKSPSALQWSCSGFVNGDKPGVVQGAPAMTTPANSGTGVGSYPVVASLGSLSASNYTFSFSPGTVVVAPAPLTVTATSQSIIYGMPLPAFTYSFSGFVNGDMAATAIEGKPSIATQASGNPKAGMYPVSIGKGTLSSANYSFVFVAGALQVQKALLQLTPLNASMTYGGKLPALTWTMSGFVNGDSEESAVAGAPALMTSASSHSEPGSFAITSGLGSLRSNNYTFAFGSGVLTVGKATLIVSVRPASMTYGGHVPTPLLEYSGFVNGDGVSSLSGNPSYAAQATSLAVGTYPVVVSIGSLASAKYSFEFENGTLTVTPAVLTVGAYAASMVYGGKVPPLSYGMHGFVNGDNVSQITGTPELETSAGVNSGAGTYPITATLGSLKAANYTFVFVGGTLTVTKATLFVIPGNVSMTYGSGVPLLPYSLSGLLNGDTANSAVGGSPGMMTVATSASPVGTYGVLASLGSLTSRNYNFAFKTGALSVVKAKLTVTASNCSMTAGGAVPTLAYTMTGLLNGETEATATSGKPGLSTSATSASKAGDYAIVAALGSLTAGNYSFTFVNGTLTVNQ